MAQRSEVFIGYHSKDKAWLERMQKHLDALEEEQKLRYWDDTRILPGSIQSAQLKGALDRARVAVLLVSADLLASKEHLSGVVKPLVEAAHRGELTLLWVPVRAALFEHSPLKPFAPVLDPKKPLAKLTSAQADEALAEITTRILEALNSIESHHMFAIRWTGFSDPVPLRYLMVFPEREAERKEAEKLHQALAAQGFHGRLVGDAELGDIPILELERAFTASEVIIMCGVGAKEMDSPEFRDYKTMFAAAMQMHQEEEKRIFPVHLTGNDMPMLLKMFRATSWVKDPVKAVEEILRAARKLEEARQTAS